eukprot:1186575-Prorocentrum_minimum.AAC.10
MTVNGGKPAGNTSPHVGSAAVGAFVEPPAVGASVVPLVIPAAVGLPVGAAVCSRWRATTVGAEEVA